MSGEVATEMGRHKAPLAVVETESRPQSAMVYRLVAPVKPMLHFLFHPLPPPSLPTISLNPVAPKCWHD